MESIRFGVRLAAIGVALAFVQCDLVAGLDSLEARRPSDAPPAPIVWAHQYGDSADQGATAVAVDGDGNIAIAGTFQGTTDFGGGPLVSAAHGTGTSVFVVKLNPAGALLWSRDFPSTDDIQVNGLRFARGGAIVFGGWFLHGIDLGGHVLSSDLPLHNAFVAELGPDGSYAWSVQTRAKEACDLNGLGLTDDSHVIVGGYLAGDTEIVREGEVIGTLTAVGGSDAFVLSLDLQGYYLAGRVYGDIRDQTVSSVVAKGKSVIITGTNAGTIDLGGAHLVTAGASDLFIAKLDSSLNPIWGADFGSPAAECFEVCETVAAIAPDDSVYFAGAYSGSVSFGGPPLTEPEADLFAARYAAFGSEGKPSHLWSERFIDSAPERPPAAPQRPYGADVDLSGRLALVGLFAGALDFGSAGVLTDDTETVKDFFVATLESSKGAPDWSLQFANADMAADSPIREARARPDIAAAPDGTLVVAGSFRGSLDVAGNVFKTPGTAPNYDAFVMKLRR